MNSIPDWNSMSTANTASAIQREAVKTKTALFMSSEREGQVVLCTNSSYESLQYALIDSNIVIRCLAREERLELPTPGFGDQCSTN